MFKKIGALAASALLAVTLMPAAAANASATPGNYVGCYGIKKKGNYNDVRLQVTGLFNGSTVSAYARQEVSASCQRVNSLPVIKMYIHSVVLRINGVNVTHAGPVNNGGVHALVRVKTPYVKVKCGAKMAAYATVSYTYYDGSKVRPFTIHGPVFKRC